MEVRSIKALSQYLQRYAEQEIQQLVEFNYHYQQLLVVPVYRESIASLERFIQWLEENHNTLLIMVVNRPDSDAKTDWCQQYYDHLLQANWCSANQQLQLFSQANNSGLLLIDRCINGPAIPKDQGVGLARKIGADVACELIYQQHIDCPWIFNTDADATLPANYFNAVNQASKTTAAIIYPFEHQFTDTTVPKLPTLLYEFSLHYYVAGLTWAGSPYAYHTIGSIIATHHLYYAKVRGFPKRSGAEDFYLLNKLAKTGNILSVKEPTIYIEARESTRVPFGTGPAVKSLAASNDLLAMPLYHPDSFIYLKALLTLITDYSLESTLPKIDKVTDKIAKEFPTINTDYLIKICQAIDLQSALEHAFKQGKKSAVRHQHLQQWFDAFKTLKTIHFLRDRYLTMINYRELRRLLDNNKQLPFINPYLTKQMNKINLLNS